MPEWEYPRAHYRIQYPVKLRPSFRIGAERYDIVDLSEGGLRYVHLPEPAPELESEIEGVVVLREGDRIPVRGVVVRLVDGQAALRLETGIPFRYIIGEQRFLLANGFGLNW